MDHKILPCAFSHGSYKNTRKELLPFYKLEVQRKLSGLFGITQLKTELDIKLCFSVLHNMTVKLWVTLTTSFGLNQRWKSNFLPVSSKYSYTFQQAHVPHWPEEFWASGEKQGQQVLTLGLEARSAYAHANLRLREQRVSIHGGSEGHWGIKDREGHQ